MIGLFGKKIVRTKTFDQDAHQIPVTVMEAGPCHGTDVKTKDKKGYTGLRLGFGAAKEKRWGKAKMADLKKANAPDLRFVREIRSEDTEGVAVGSKVAVDNFEVGEYVDVEAVSKGRGFQGVVKRHHFKGALTFSHGDMSRRRPGSIGASSFPSR